MCDSCEWREFVEEAETLIGQLDELPSRAADFSESVGQKVGDMLEWARANEHATEKMKSALQNMQSGANRWLDR
jgi:hypothetical protein